MNKKQYFTHGNPDAKRKILVISGTHGNETNAILSTVMLNTHLSREGAMDDMDASIDILVGWNETGIEANTRESHRVDNSLPDDLNRAFFTEPDVDGKEMGVRYVKELIDSHDIIIDVHNSHHICNSVLINFDLYAYPYILFCAKNDIAQCIRENASDTIKKYAIDQGKVGFTVELDEMGVTMNNYDKLNDNYAFLLKVVTAATNLSLDDFKQKAVEVFDPACLNREMYTHADGYVAYKKKDAILTHYEQGDDIAKIRTYDNTTVETIYAPCDGTLISVADSLVLNAGDFFGIFQPDVIPLL